MLKTDMSRGYLINLPELGRKYENALTRYIASRDDFVLSMFYNMLRYRYLAKTVVFHRCFFEIEFYINPSMIPSVFCLLYKYLE